MPARRTLAVLVTTVAAFAAPAPVHAGVPCSTEDRGAALDQYCDPVGAVAPRLPAGPSDGGDRASGGGAGAPVGDAARRRLRRSGADGEALLRFADPERPGRPGAAGAPGGGRTGDADGADGAAGSAAPDGADGSGGAGRPGAAPADGRPPVGGAAPAGQGAPDRSGGAARTPAAAAVPADGPRAGAGLLAALALLTAVVAAVALGERRRRRQD